MGALQYHDDFSQSQDLAAKYPDKLKDLQQLFLAQAEKYDALPLTTARWNARFPSWRPAITDGRPHVADTVPRNGRDNGKRDTRHQESLTHNHRPGRDTYRRRGGVILAQGGRFAGWSLYMKDGKLKYCYNWFNKERYTIESPNRVPAGKATLRFDFAYDGAGVGKGGTGRLYVNGEKVAEGRIENTVPYIFSADETEDVGETSRRR